MSKDLPTYIAIRQLRDRYGGVSHMWIKRRMAADPGFPRPFYFGTRRFWSLAELEAWERATAAKQERMLSELRRHSTFEPAERDARPGLARRHSQGAAIQTPELRENSALEHRRLEDQPLRNRVLTAFKTRPRAMRRNNT